MGEQQPHNRQTAQDKERERSNANQKTKYYFPFRWFQHILRDAEREDAHNSNDRDYHKSGNSDLRRAVQRGNKFWTKVRSGWTAEGVIAVFTIVLVCETYYQWDIMRDQNALMRDQMQLERRAWVGVVEAAAEQVVAGKPFECVISIKNSGQTPAFVDRRTGMVLLYSADDAVLGTIVEAILRVNPKNTNEPLPPGLVATAPVTGNQALTEQMAKEVIDGSRQVYVAGTIFYTDVFENRRHTAFCLAYDHVKKNLHAHHKYNHMD